MRDPFLDPGQDLLVGRLVSGVRRRAAITAEEVAGAPGAGVAPFALASEMHLLPGAAELPGHRAGLLDPGVGPLGVPGRGELVGHVDQHAAHPTVDAVHIARRLLLPQRRDDQQVHRDPHGDAEPDLQDPVQQQRLLLPEAGTQHEDRGGRDRDPFVPDPRHQRHDHADGQGEREGPDAHPEPRADHEGQRDAEDRGDQGLQAAGDGSVHRDVHREQGGPRGQERHLGVEHVP